MSGMVKNIVAFVVNQETFILQKRNKIDESL